MKLFAAKTHFSIIFSLLEDDDSSDEINLLKIIFHAINHNKL